MSEYTPLEYDSDCDNTSDTLYGTSTGKSDGKSPESAHGKFPGSTYGKFPESAYGTDSELKHGRCPGKDTDSRDKCDRKMPFKILEKFDNPSESESAETRREIEQYYKYSTKINASNSRGFEGAKIFSKITGLDREHEFSYLGMRNETEGKQLKEFSSGSITPKLPHPLKVRKSGLKEGEESVHDLLYNACLTGDLGTVKDILRVHYDTLMPDEQGQTPLYAACIGNQPEIIEYLVARGYTVDHQDNDGKTPLHVAFEFDEPAIAKLLLNKYDASYKLRDARNWSPLHYAVDHGYYEMCSRVLRYFLETDAGTDVSWIQMLAACFERKLDTVEFLLATNADVNHVNSSGHSPLHIACVQNDTAILKLLLQYGAQKTINLPTSSRNLAAIHNACARNHPSIVRLLLEHGADPNLACVGNKTPCHVAVATGSVDALQCLVKCPNTNIDAVDSDGNTCLQNAVHRRNLEIVTLLLSNNAKVNTINRRGISPLHAAVYKPDDGIAQALCEHNADPNVLDKNGHTCLQLALRKRREEYVPALLKAGADMSACDEDGDDCLQLAIYKGISSTTLQLLIEHGAPLEHKNRKGFTALSIATRKSNLDGTVQLLLKSGCDPNVADEEGDSVLHNAVKKRFHTDTVQALLDRGANPNAINFKGHTALMIACADDPVDLFQLLLENGADPNISNWEGDSPLLVACMKHDCTKVTLLLMHGADVTHTSNTGREPLGYAVRANNTHLLGAFVNHSPAVLNTTMVSGETALHYCCRNGRADLIEWMLMHGVDKDKICEQGTPIYLALHHGHKNIVFMLIDAGADVSMSPERPGFVGRIYSQRHLYMDILEHIVTTINCKVDFTACDAAHETLFFKACRDDDVDLVQMLLDSKHDIGINIANKEGQTPVAIICANAGKPESEALSLLSMIINSGRAVDVDKADRKQTTPLHLVSQADNLFMVNLIGRYSRGSVNARDSMGRTPVQLAKTAQVINLLVTLGATKD